jgi:methylated-DNA-[protein]-cysteine S-methyltransferase
LESKSRYRNMIFETLFGYCALLFRENPFYLVRVLLPTDKKDHLRRIVQKEVWGIPGFHPEAKSIAVAIIDYFTGKPSFQTLPWNLMDIQHLTPLQQQVLRITSEIPYGKVCTYKEIAQALKRPRAYRFAGSCMAKNPFPIIIPCHRVVRSDSSVGNFGGGSEMKKKMIEQEAVNISIYNGLQATINYGSRKL